MKFRPQWSPWMVRWMHDRASVIGAWIGVKAYHRLVGLWLSIVPLLGGGTSPYLVSGLRSFAKTIHGIYRHGGMKFLVIYLKAAQVLTMQALGGDLIRDTSPFKARVSRSRSSGLPRIIPAEHRALMRKGNTFIIRLWLTLFGTYRILSYPGSVNLRTITDLPAYSPKPGIPVIGVHPLDRFYPFFAVYKRLLKVTFPSTWRHAGFSESTIPLKALQAIQPRALFPIRKSSPTSTFDGLISMVSTSLYSIVVAAVSIVNDPQLMGAFKQYLCPHPTVKNPAMIISTLDPVTGPKTDITFLELLEAVARGTVLPEGFVNPPLGKLGFKEEPAGKVRAFAMVDPWTQWLLKPLHEHLFSILRDIPQDGTFDQLGALQSLIDRADKSKGLYSLDLTAATDRLPLDLQAELLSELYSPAMATAWETLLVKARPYLAKSNKFGLNELVFYGTGQPMGAYSSWAMLAHTQHFIVQFAAWEIAVKSNMNPKWFTDYAVVGDDIIIADPDIAASYLRIMKDIGVDISLHKSVRSPDALAGEFVKRFIYKGQDLSPISWLEAISAPSHLGIMVSLIKSFNGSLNAMLALAGYGYKARGSVNQPFQLMAARLRTYVLSFISPNGVKPRSLTNFINATGLSTQLEVKSAAHSAPAVKAILGFRKSWTELQSKALILVDSSYNWLEKVGLSTGNQDFARWGKMARLRGETQTELAIWPNQLEFPYPASVPVSHGVMVDFATTHHLYAAVYGPYSNAMMESIYNEDLVHALFSPVIDDPMASDPVSAGQSWPRGPDVQGSPEVPLITVAGAYALDPLSYLRLLWDVALLDPLFNFELEILEAQLISSVPTWLSVENRLDTIDEPNILDVTRWIDIHARAWNRLTYDQVLRRNRRLEISRARVTPPHIKAVDKGSQDS